MIIETAVSLIMRTRKLRLILDLQLKYLCKIFNLKNFNKDNKTKSFSQQFISTNYYKTS